jgi:hypothetical protein
MLSMRPRHAAGSLAVVVLLAALWLLSNRPSPKSTTTPVPGAPAAARAGEGGGGTTGSVPVICTPEVNQKLAELVAQQTTENVDNVMVCGVTISASRTQRAGEHGSHQILPLLVNLPGEGSKLVEVVTNDDLDGVVTAPKGAQVIAYGQAFFDGGSRFVAGIHDVHCATHRGADNGWVKVDGRKFPASCSSFGNR